MTENDTVTPEVEAEAVEVEETYETDEQGIAYSSESAPAADAPLRPATIAPAAATGRRKEAVARVRIVPGTGEWTINVLKKLGMGEGEVHQDGPRRGVRLERRRRPRERLDPGPQRLDHQRASSRAASGA